MTMVNLRTIGQVMIVLAVVMAGIGWIGFTVEGEVNDVPTPNFPDRSFFAEDPLPEQAFSPFLTAELTLTWDRNDVYAVIVDEDEKRTCESTPTGLAQNSGTTSCGPYDADIVAIGDNGDEGLVWTVDSGIHYVGVGTVGSGLPQGAEVNMVYAVHLQAGFASFFAFAAIGAVGFAMTRSE